MPEEILEEAVFLGTGIAADKKKINDSFLTLASQTERIRILREVYYYVMLHVDGIFVKQLQANPRKGLLILWESREMKRQEWVAWEKVEHKVMELVHDGRYLIKLNVSSSDEVFQPIVFKEEEVRLEAEENVEVCGEIQNEIEYEETDQEKDETTMLSMLPMIEESLYSYELETETIELSQHQEGVDLELACYINEKEWYSSALMGQQLKKEEQNKWRDDLCRQHHLSSGRPRQNDFEGYKEDNIYRLDNFYLEKQDLLEFAATLQLTDIRTRRDDLTAYWRVYDKSKTSKVVKKEEVERNKKIRDLERALNGTNDSITLTLHKKYELWLKKNPKLEQKYKKKQKKGRGRSKIKEGSRLAECLSYIEELEVKKIDGCIMVMPAIVISYVVREYLSLHPDITYKRYDSVDEYITKDVNLIFMKPEQYELSGLKEKRRLEYLQSKLELVRRYIYMEQRVQEQNRERILYFIKIEQKLSEMIKNICIENKVVEKLSLDKKKFYFYENEDQEEQVEEILLGKHI